MESHQDLKSTEKSLEGEIISIDPTNLNDEQGMILKAFLQKREQEKTGVIFSKDGLGQSIPYQITLPGENQPRSFTLTKDLAFSPKPIVDSDKVEPRWLVFNYIKHKQKTSNAQIAALQGSLFTERGKNLSYLKQAPENPTLLKITTISSQETGEYDEEGRKMEAIQREAEQLKKSPTYKGKDVIIGERRHNLNDHRSNEVISIESMKHLKGYDLGILLHGPYESNQIKKITDLTVKQRLKLFLNILEKLWEMHDSGIIHNDIKPANIMFNPDTLEVHILDYGSYRYKDEEKAIIDLTAKYAPLESLIAFQKEDEELLLQRDQKSDVYSLGLIGIEICGGSIEPKLDPNRSEIEQRIEIAKQPRFLNDLFTGFKEKLTSDERQSIQYLFKKMTEVEQDERFTAEEVLDKFDKIYFNFKMRNYLQHAPENEQDLLRDMILDAHNNAIAVQAATVSEKSPALKPQMMDLKNKWLYSIAKLADHPLVIEEFIDTLNIGIFNKLESPRKKQQLIDTVKSQFYQFYTYLDEFQNSAKKIEASFSLLETIAKRSPELQKNAAFIDVKEKLQRLIYNINYLVAKPGKREFTLNRLIELNERFERELKDIHKAVLIVEQEIAPLTANQLSSKDLLSAFNNNNNNKLDDDMMHSQRLLQLTMENFSSKLDIPRYKIEAEKIIENITNPQEAQSPENVALHNIATHVSYLKESLGKDATANQNLKVSPKDIALTLKRKEQASEANKLLENYITFTKDSIQSFDSKTTITDVLKTLTKRIQNNNTIKKREEVNILRLAMIEQLDKLPGSYETRLKIQEAIRLILDDVMRDSVPDQENSFLIAMLIKYYGPEKSNIPNISSITPALNHAFINGFRHENSILTESAREAFKNLRFQLIQQVVDPIFKEQKNLNSMVQAEFVRDNIMAVINETGADKASIKLLCDVSDYLNQPLFDSLRNEKKNIFDDLTQTIQDKLLDQIKKLADTTKSDTGEKLILTKEEDTQISAILNTRTSTSGRVARWVGFSSTTNEFDKYNKLKKEHLISVEQPSLRYS